MTRFRGRFRRRATRVGSSYNVVSIVKYCVRRERARQHCRETKSSLRERVAPAMRSGLDNQEIVGGITNALIRLERFRKNRFPSSTSSFVCVCSAKLNYIIFSYSILRELLHLTIIRRVKILAPPMTDFFFATDQYIDHFLFLIKRNIAIEIRYAVFKNGVKARSSYFSTADWSNFDVGS